MQALSSKMDEGGWLDRRTVHGPLTEDWSILEIEVGLKHNSFLYKYFYVRSN